MNPSDEVYNLPFIEKLCTVVELGILDFWESRENPPNLSAHEFRSILIRVNEIENFKWIPRMSTKGPHGRDGEDFCFKFECDVHFGGIVEIESKRYFIKGYFFTKDELQGVTIQSFREEY